ncbi:alpha/beta-hydrolase [Astrocystis sublimbata]|nr:alpha/beta-hydrolase [Astrocystis sublimbata]
MPHAQVLSADQQRQFMIQAEATGLEDIGPCPPHLGEAWVEIPLPDGQVNKTKIVWPRSPSSASAPRPLVVFYHGGGYSVGTPNQNDTKLVAPARGLATVFSCVVACPSLNQLSEQVPFPGPVKMAWEVCAWLSDASNLNNGVLNGAGASVDPALGFTVSGLSSGAAAAAVIGSIPDAIAAGVEEFQGLTPLHHAITGVFSGIPFMVTEGMLPAQYRELLKSRDEIIENKEANAAMRRDLESRLAPKSPWFSPINLDLSKFVTRHHPRKVFIYAGEIDQFRDDALIYKTWLEQLEGVEVKHSVLEGVGHFAWSTLLWPACREHRLKEVLLDGFAWLLNQEWDRSQDLP